MKVMRYALGLGGIVMIAVAYGFIAQSAYVVRLWPWPDGRLSYLFIGSIVAATCASMLWIAASGEMAALAGGSLNILVISAGTCIYLLKLLLMDQREELLPFALAGIAAAAVSAAAFAWSRHKTFADTRPAPMVVRVSFMVFLVALLLAAVGLLFRLPVFPWAVLPDSSVIFGCIFLGNACYFLYGLLLPRWHNTKGQLLSFLAYDLVLIFPFLMLFPAIQPRFLVSLVVYIVVLVVSGGIAVYYLFIDRATRFPSASQGPKLS
jgi:hypothetical protein